MHGIDELSRTIGKLEGSVEAMHSNQENLIAEVARLNTSLGQRTWFDSAKVIIGGFFGGFVAFLTKDCLIR